MNIRKEEFLRKKANFIRDEVIDVSLHNKAGHIASALSCVDIIVALYYHAMRYKPSRPLWEGRDRLVFSKGHGCYALYAVLVDLKIIPRGEWRMISAKKNTLLGCVERKPKYGLEAGCGSLGHGLPVAVGMALAAKLERKNYHIFCVIGDGEMQEGTTWEALQFALKHGLGNLTVIIDSNSLQAMDFIVEVMDKKKDDKIKRLKGFGFSPFICPGHDVVKLAKRICVSKLVTKSKPKVIIAETVKGYGLKCMENVPKFHFRVPDKSEMAMGRTYEKRG